MSTLLALAALSTISQTPSIRQYVQTDFRDATFVARVLKANTSELAKINKDFGTSYKFRTTTIRVKEPFKLRLDAEVEDTHVLYIINGPKLIISIPRMKVNSKQDLTTKPGRRQTLLDFGILTPSLFEDLFEAKFVRNDRATGNTVFDLTFPARLDDTSRQRIWIDTSRKIVTKREWYNQYGRQMATFYYTEPKEVGGVWMPTRLEVRNVDNVVAGTTRYDSIQVNTGLAESYFTK